MHQVTILKESCKGCDDCGICIYVCPQKLFSPSGEINQRGYVPPVLSRPEDCTGCLSCMLFCPDMAIVVALAEEEAQK